MGILAHIAPKNSMQSFFGSTAEEAQTATDAGVAALEKSGSVVMSVTPVNQVRDDLYACQVLYNKKSYM